MSKPEYELIDLPNGIRVIHREVNCTKIANVGIMLDIGSRDELDDEQGLTHFLEHMAFKGTKKRSSYHIISRLESLGGELNAYTTKEKLCFYASLLHIHLEKAIELLCDITFHSIFPAKEIEKERKVILEEMTMYGDNPEDAIQDDFDELVFADHPLGKNIMGTKKTVNAFRQQDFHQFLERRLNTEKIILASIGNYSAKKIQRLAEKYLKVIPHKNHTADRDRFANYQSVSEKKKRPISQAHFALGMPSLSIRDENRIPFFFLVNLLGGPSMSSRLSLSLREKHGFVYSIDANYSPYLETGLFGIYFATDLKNLKQSQRIVFREIEAIKRKPLGKLQLQKAKNQIKGQMILSVENKNATMLMMAKSLLDLKKVPDLNEVFKKIDAISSARVQELARAYLPIDQMSSLTYQPEGL